MPTPLASVTLEMSLKPFRAGFDAANVERVCRELFRQWDALTRHARAVQVLLWASDGSEILEYAGDLDAGMEWARYIGGANRNRTSPHDPNGDGLHARSHLYCPHPPALTYRGLAGVVAALRRIGEAATGLPVRVGATFDPGPEFARSRFKYDWHPEICLGGSMGAGTFVCCYATLAADRRSYAGFPQGIPAGLPFGTFFGRQARLFLADLGFDYLWLSNGFGFGMETWGVKGAVFDGTAFHPERRHECGDRILAFWRLLRAELPGVAIETRGTNLLTGTDIGGDGVPLRDIYRGGFAIQAPPNSPWAALDHDFGLELTGWMSHVAELPPDNGAFPFRYYIHDPWWLNSPWLDRYGREAHDIHLPGAVARLDAGGHTGIPDRISLLTVDDSLGDMPVQVPDEVIPHLLEARRTGPDQAGPLLWVYPFDEYHEHAFGADADVETPWAGDWHIRGAINQGLPLNTVVSTTAFARILAETPAAVAGRILVTPVPRAGDAMDALLAAWMAGGGRVLLYGSTAHASPALRALIGVRLADPLAGEGIIDLDLADDGCAVPAPRLVRHRALLNAGGCAEIADGADVLATLAFPAGRRAVATLRGGCAWVRGGNGTEYRESHHPTQDRPDEVFPAERLARLVLARFGWSIRMERSAPGQPGHTLTVHRSGNGWFFAGLARRTTVPLHLRSPDGAPLLLGHDARLVAGHAVYHLPRAWRRECRVFIDQAADGEVSCDEGTHERMGAIRRFWVRGLVDATVVIYPQEGRTAGLLLDPHPPYVIGREPEHVREDGGRRIVCRHVTGPLCITW